MRRCAYLLFLGLFVLGCGGSGGTVVVPPAQQFDVTVSKGSGNADVSPYTNANFTGVISKSYDGGTVEILGPAGQFRFRSEKPGFHRVLSFRFVDLGQPLIVGKSYATSSISADGDQYCEVRLYEWQDEDTEAPWGAWLSNGRSVTLESLNRENFRIKIENLDMLPDGATEAEGVLSMSGTLTVDFDRE